MMQTITSIIDYIASWGPMILGHAYQPVVDAIREYAAYSTSFGAPTELEIEMAELIISMAPNVDLIRMVRQWYRSLHEWL
jgi:glutamate-1-semialdehyde 2,1-aminomutase